VKGTVLWILAGTVFMALLGLMFFLGKGTGQPFAAKARKTQVVEQMRRDLASAAEAERSAVLAVTDEESQRFARQSRAAAAGVAAAEKQLGTLLEQSQEKELLARFGQTFAELQKIDDEVLALAVQNSNIKAYALAYGPAAQTLKEMDGALSRILLANAESGAPHAQQAMLNASRAQSAALRIAVLLPPHIAEESDAKMAALESQMAVEDRAVHASLEVLAGIASKAQAKDVESAKAAYERFSADRKQILSLSRQNTNVRSLSLSLNQARKALLNSQDALASLEQAIRGEPEPHMTNPR
jgi:hypothetical protein